MKTTKCHEHICVSMARNTARDEIWSTAMKIRNGLALGSMFDASDVQDQIDGDVSLRTIRDTLNSMYDKGHLSASGGRGRRKKSYGHPRHSRTCASCPASLSKVGAAEITEYDDQTGQPDLRYQICFNCFDGGRR